jgi:hypothetical protein
MKHAKVNVSTRPQPENRGEQEFIHCARVVVEGIINPIILAKNQDSVKRNHSSVTVEIIRR